MRKSAFIVISLFTLMGSPTFAGTSAVVEYGTVQESRLIPQAASHQSGARPLRTLGAAALGAAVGSQFGGGSGQTVATTVGAVAGAEVSRRRQGDSVQSKPRVELLIKTEAGKLLSVVQDQEPALTFAKGERVRILTTGADTRVDKSL
ncbi:glycine zipper 2TM domain-containing protein [Aeromonas taiwanensis]|uniref:glycine zipper 2TM domain-containing protein n=1 Tax=Aeromonas taiwanensis TaxID=633417 RepID=UPI00207C6A70|nr:glycine zipper 2TM domain-containing protein [Aeromonas taiwanensis]